MLICSRELIRSLVNSSVMAFWVIVLVCDCPVVVSSVVRKSWVVWS